MHNEIINARMRRSDRISIRGRGEKSGTAHVLHVDACARAAFRLCPNGGRRKNAEKLTTIGVLCISNQFSDTYYCVRRYYCRHYSAEIIPSEAKHVSNA